MVANLHHDKILETQSADMKKTWCDNDGALESSGFMERTAKSNNNFQEHVILSVYN